MSEATAVDQDVVEGQVVDSAAADAEFDSGFADKPTVTPPAEETDETAEAGEAAPAAADVAPEVKYKQITEDEWTALQAAAAEITQIKAEQRKELDRAFGKVGGLERTLKEIQSATPQGLTVDVSDDVVADLKAEFPELGDLTLKALKKFAGGLKGTAPVTGQDPQQVEAAISGRIRAMQEEALDDEHPDWRAVVGDPDSETEYRKWLAKQDAAYQQKLNATNSAAIIGRSISKFKSDAAAAAAAAEADAKAQGAKDAAEKAKKAAADARQQRLASATTESGKGGHESAPTDDDAFNEGFNS